MLIRHQEQEMGHGANCQQQEEHKFLQAWDARMADLSEALDMEHMAMLQRQAQELADLEVGSLMGLQGFSHASCTTPCFAACSSQGASSML